MKFAFLFWEIKGHNIINTFQTLKNDEFSKPLLYLQTILGLDVCIDFADLEKRSDRDEFIIISFLGISPFSLRYYWKLFTQYRKNKKYLILFEPPVIEPLSYCRWFHGFFDRVYAYDERLWNSRYKQFTVWKTLEDNRIHPVGFEQKKFVAMVNTYKYSFFPKALFRERIKAVSFFQSTIPNDFDLYGHSRDKKSFLKKIFTGFWKFSTKWRIPDKIQTLAWYKFNLCFENSSYNWYITEKLWDSFKAKTVPIYLGAENVKKYIPADTFIDFRDFWCNYEKLLLFIQHIDEKTYQKYITNISAFLSSKEIEKHFDKERAKDFINKLS